VRPPREALVLASPGHGDGSTAGSPHVAGRTALILSFFAMAWFSWGQAEASGVLSAALNVGSAVALAVLVWAAITACHRVPEDGAAREGVAPGPYGRLVAVEFGLCGLGALALGAAGAPDYIPVWICAVVGWHFFPLASVLGASALRWLGWAVSAVAVAALLAGLFADVAPGSVTGAGAGLALLAFATLVLARS
jgi:hypothetical protein